MSVDLEIASVLRDVTTKQDLISAAAMQATPSTQMDDVVMVTVTSSVMCHCM